MSNVERVDYVSQYGMIGINVRDGRLAGVRLGQRRSGRAEVSEQASPFVEALSRYFGRKPLAVPAEALDLDGVDSFRRKVYDELMKVPFGEVVTYGELADRAGKPGGARAAGQAVGANPLPIFVPCHRVVAADGSLGGFSAGPRWKANLLTHEGWTVEKGRLVAKGAKDQGLKTCVYAGTFDPPTNGHMYMIAKGAALFGRLVVAVGVNPNKSSTFPLRERLGMLRECTKGLGNVEVDSFEGQFLAHYATSKGAAYILRGIRSDEDYRFEHTMRNVNEDLEPGLTTVFLIPPRQICDVSSSFVKGLVGFRGWEEVVRPYVPGPVYKRLLANRMRRPKQSLRTEGDAD